MQTNGIYLSPKSVILFKAYSFQVNVSLDGPPSVHEKLRGMAAEIFKGLQLLESAGVPFRGVG
jgi:sulfatase maturation enzyme AslB (radical SAM superfamily)